MTPLSRQVPEASEPEPDLVTRFFQAIEEAEQKALAVPEHLRVDHWTHPGPWVMHGEDGRSANEVALVRMTGRQAEAIAEHIADNDPASVLRRCAGDRKIVDECAAVLAEEWERQRTDGWPSAEREGLAETVLEYLAEGYGISLEQENPQ